ncbi:MAG: hypothetical protein Q8Q94_03110 [bacterium]|nr:hypothetical protein [bacterium]MDZ4299402.1 hypothetical protein [Candidatus Sungbacteria bacterium]
MGREKFILVQSGTNQIDLLLAKGKLEEANISVRVASDAVQWKIHVAAADVLEAKRLMKKT